MYVFKYIYSIYNYISISIYVYIYICINSGESRRESDEIQVWCLGRNNTQPHKTDRYE